MDTDFYLVESKRIEVNMVQFRVVGDYCGLSPIGSDKGFLIESIITCEQIKRCRQEHEQLLRNYSAIGFTFTP